MNINELMLNDWVQLDDEFYTVKGIGLEHHLITLVSPYIPFKPHAKPRVKECPYIGAHISEVKNFLDRIKPIPLTPEILKKNGFESRGAQFFCEHIGMIWWKDNIFMFSKYTRHEGLPTENISINIGYVHELQHALRLCSIDKIIVL